MKDLRPSLSFLLSVVLASTALAVPDRGERELSRRSSQAPAPVVVEGYRLPGTLDAAKVLADRQRLADWLVGDMVFEALESPAMVELTRADRFALVNPDPNDRPYRVGVVKELGLLVDLSGLTPGRKPNAALPFGQVRWEDDGGLTWTAAIVSEDATALRLHLTELHLPAQARLFVHDLQGAADGPIVHRGPHGDGELWTRNVFGEVAVIQLRVDGPVTPAVLDGLRFVIEDVGHSGDRFHLGAAQSQEKAHCSGNRECVQNAECSTAQSWGPIGNTQDAIAHYQYVSGAFLYICSGGLLADTVQSGRAYFLTANHCIDRDRHARTMDTFFNFTVACNTSNCPGPGSPSTSGASILSTDSEADYTFMELDGPLPQGVYFMPWDDAPVANSDGTALHRVSHPSGEPQAYSTHDVDTSRTTCRSWPRGPWIYSTDTYGATEGGSSGSPVTNAAGDVVGQLSGACGFNTGDECDSVNNATVDGAFAHYYPAIEQWLDPTGCTPSPEVCDNGIDDDCDGQVDCDDDNCSAALNCGDTGGGGCGPGAKGDPCSSNDDCASCNCKRGSCKGG